MIVDVEVAQEELGELVELAKAGEDVLIRDGDTIVQLEPIDCSGQPGLP
ncbi:MAG: hypothetical protein IT174_12100 [Acidobacteria bacterium]|nr:hypothetical protein [Acidobacteriota bacterium]